ncbi:MAG: class B sortase [Bacilli bacterium]
MKSKHSKKKNKKDIIYNFLIIIFIIIIIYSGIEIYKWYCENKKTDDIKKEIEPAIIVDKVSEDVEKYTVDFNKLKEKNSDIVAWLKVPNTNIEYPVVRAKDNSYYLNHSLDKSYNGAGWIFMDYKNKLDSTDKNIVIYGHNRKDGSMFGSLHNILKEEWYNNSENYIIQFVTENGEEQYQVFSVYQIEKEDYYIKTNFSNDNEFQNFINTIKSRSYKDFEINVTKEDQILTLSTCANNNKYRVVLHAVKEK